MSAFTSVDAYLDAAPPERRARLEELRALVRSVAPEASEGIAYQMPAWKVGRRFLVSFAWFKAHDSLFPASEAVLLAVPAARAWARSRGTFRFPLAEPLPLEVIRAIVLARVAELDEEAAAER